MYRGLVQPTSAPATGVPFSNLSATARSNATAITSAGATALGTTQYGYVVVNAASGNSTLTLPAISALSTVPQWYVITRSDGSSNSVTVNVSGSNVFSSYGSGSSNTSYKLSKYQTIELYADGNNTWSVIDSQSTLNTPAQFDNSNKTATTAFVQRALGNFSSHSWYSASSSLTAANSGGLIGFTGTSSFTLTMPPMASLGDGSVFRFVNFTSLNQTIQMSGAEVFVLPGGNGTATSMTLYPGDTVDIMCINSGWDVIGGTSLLKYSSYFGSSLSANGYQRLPSGVIIQWGTFNSSTSGGTTITFPTAFPNSCSGLSGIDITATGAAGRFTASSVTNTSFSGACYNGTSYVADGIKWMAIGY